MQSYWSNWSGDMTARCLLAKQLHSVCVRVCVVHVYMCVCVHAYMCVRVSMRACMRAQSVIAPDS